MMFLNFLFWRRGNLLAFGEYQFFFTKPSKKYYATSNIKVGMLGIYKKLPKNISSNIGLYLQGKHWFIRCWLVRWIIWGISFEAITMSYKKSNTWCLFLNSNFTILKKKRKTKKQKLMLFSFHATTFSSWGLAFLNSMLALLTIYFSFYHISPPT
jgi:hypothetical protein